MWIKWKSGELFFLGYLIVGVTALRGVMTESVKSIFPNVMRSYLAY